MSFKNETLEMILERLEKWYGQKIECAPPYCQTLSLYFYDAQRIIGFDFELYFTQCAIKL